MAIQQISLITDKERNSVISDIRKAISKAGGWILDHTLLSNMAATLVFELPCDRIADFYDDLKNRDLTLDVRLAPTQSPELCASLSITFVHNDPDLRRDVPAFG